MRTTLLGLCLLVACGGTDRPDPDPDAAVTLDAPTAPTDAVSSTLCGGFTNARCADREYCDYGENFCGVADGLGTCRPRPNACPAVEGPEVCACDGKVHASECAAYADGFDLSANGSCDNVRGKFACGYLLCDLATEYCRREPHPDAAETFACLTLPGCQAEPSCACIEDERCGDACTGDSDLGLTLTCPATPR